MKKNFCTLPRGILIISTTFKEEELEDDHPVEIPEIQKKKPNILSKIVSTEEAFTETPLQTGISERKDNFENEESKSPINFQPIKSKRRKISITSKKKIKLMREILKKEFNGKWIILPDDPLRAHWSLVITLLIFYSMLVTPFRIAFVDDDSMTWEIINEIVDVFFLIDIMMNFFNAFIDSDHNLIHERKLIAFAYLKSWFVFDLIAILPIFLIVEKGDSYSGLTRVTRLTRMYRLIRMSKMLRLAKVVKERQSLMKHLSTAFRLKSGFQRIIMIIITLLFLCHITSCFWYLMARLEDFEPNTWVARYNYLDSGIMEVYLGGFYRCITTITTVGYGDICASTVAES